MFDVASFGASAAWSFLLTVLAGIAALWARGATVAVRRRLEGVYDYVERRALEVGAAEALVSLPPPEKESSPKTVKKKNSGVEEGSSGSSGLSEED